ncbi:MAG: fumarylacetoacetate hydrolase family protein [Planctomycetota bacterium]|nr:fumarylacetoacetate hydrolase family protein [Planctomycetota bacterium]MDP6988598.1 fumarylacetoacetate hydrolase family protein [Planctomycetota bacterium]
MRLISFLDPAGGPPRTGAFCSDGSEVLDAGAAAAGLPEVASPLDWFDLDGAAHPALAELCASLEAEPSRADALRAGEAIVPLESVRLTAPVPRPGKFLCIGRNYREHAAEGGEEVPEAPLYFSKFQTSVTGHEQPVLLPLGSEKVDYEAELGVVVGRRAFRVSREHAREHVLGYTNINDVSARDFQFGDGQWQRGKSCDTFGPMGPFVATTEEIADPQALRISFRLNGETLQDSTTALMVFGVDELVSYLSQTVTLEPGDVIATGTPPGVGFARKPPIWVREGDRMEVDIEGLGVLANPVTSTPPGA